MAENHKPVVGAHTSFVDRQLTYFATAFYWALGALIVFSAICFSREFMRVRQRGHPLPLGILESQLAWDGDEYLGIARDGYHFEPRQPSTVAFFPAYPLAARVLSAVTHTSLRVSLLVISQVSSMGGV